MLSPEWEEVHRTRPWQSLPQEQMVIWLLAQFPGEDRSKIKILDLGCGQGPSTIYLAQYGFHIVALDGSPSALKKLKANISNGYDSNVHLVCSDMSKLGFPDGYFDVVLDIASICHNDNYQEIFDEVARVLRVGGGFFSVLPAADANRDPFMGFGPVNFFEKEHIKDFLNEKFIINIAYKRLDNGDGQNLLSQWLVLGIKK